MQSGRVSAIKDILGNLPSIERGTKDYMLMPQNCLRIAQYKPDLILQIKLNQVIYFKNHI